MSGDQEAQGHRKQQSRVRTLRLCGNVRDSNYPLSLPSTMWYELLREGLVAEKLKLGIRKPLQLHSSYYALLPSPPSPRLRRLPGTSWAHLKALGCPPDHFYTLVPSDHTSWPFRAACRASPPLVSPHQSNTWLTCGFGGSGSICPWPPPP